MPLVNEATADFLYVRWEGDRKTVNGTMGKTEADRINQIQAWAEKLKPVLDSETHVFGTSASTTRASRRQTLANF